jgi:hypothetical protein
LVSVSQGLYHAQPGRNDPAYRAVVIDGAELSIPVLDRSVIPEILYRSGSGDLFRERHYESLGIEYFDAYRVRGIYVSLPRIAQWEAINPLIWFRANNPVEIAVGKLGLRAAKEAP